MNLFCNLFSDLFRTKIAYADLNSFIGNVDTMIINPLILLLFALAVVYFLYGVLEFVMNQENEEKKTTGKSHMLWGVVGITIMLGVWTILGMVINTLGIKGVDPANGTVNLTQ
jgi:succinate dehydrogenase/fumarate reductase cytochrome b subunit